MNKEDIKEKDIQRLLLKHSLIFPLTFICIIWIVFFLDKYADINMSHMGIYPLRIEGLKGIIFSPLIHKDFSHLISNTIPLFVLMWSIFYFYRSLAYRIFFLSYILSGFWLWFGAREGWHIGASGLVYAFAAFTFLSGILRKHRELMALSLVIVFLYGHLIWGMLPLTRDTDISYEGHLLGAIAGVIIAFYYRHKGPQKKITQWDEDEDYNELDEDLNNEEKNFYNN